MISSALALLILVASSVLPDKSEATPWKTLDYLYSIRGQAIGISGKNPGLWGGDFLFDAESIEHRWGMVEEAKKQWDDGVVISIMW